MGTVLRSLSRTEVSCGGTMVPGLARHLARAFLVLLLQGCSADGCGSSKATPQKEVPHSTREPSRPGAAGRSTADGGKIQDHRHIRRARDDEIGDFGDLNN
jgi:hypothetical protein